MVLLRRATTVVLNPCHPATARYNQIAAIEINNVAKKIVTSASILLSPHLAAPLFGRAVRLLTTLSRSYKPLLGDFVVNGLPASHFPCHKLPGR